jgi:hypothetical protein
MKKNIVCLKWGEKYSPHYVNVLYKMCKRHSNVPFNFFCLTDNIQGLSPEIIHKPLPNLPLQGWWMKPWVFARENNFSGQVLFLDLDLIIYDNIDKLWNCSTGDFMIIRDFTRAMNPNWQKFNSSVFRFTAENYYWIWDDFVKDHKSITTKNFGDQDYLYKILQTQARTWPDNWIQSYKWEMRNRDDIKVVKGKRNFINIKDPTLSSDGCIAVFHGEPNPHDVQDPWVIKNWQ